MKAFDRATVFLIFFVCVSPMVYAADLEGSSVQDAYIAGQLTAILERELHWERHSYDLAVKNGVAYLGTRGELEHLCLPRLSELGIEGLTDLHVVTQDTKSQAAQLSPPRAKAYSVLGLTEHTEAFPVGDIFEPLIADPKQPRFFGSIREYEILDPDGVSREARVGAVGFGETFGLYRRDGTIPGNGLQLSLSAGVFAQFNLDAESDDLVNADYVVGLPFTYRHNKHSARVRLYHQSSHLGDEFLLNVQPERINLSFEALELLYSYDWAAWRGYVGGERVFSIEPADVKKTSLHGGLEFRSGFTDRRRGQWIAGADLKSFEQHDWSIDWSLKVGYEFDAASEGQRLRILAEAYDGFTPHGQFYNTETEFYGIGFFFGY